MHVYEKKMDVPCDIPRRMNRHEEVFERHCELHCPSYKTQEVVSALAVQHERNT